MIAWCLLAGAASAGEGAVDASLHADVKTFIVATFPYDSLLMPDGAQGQGIAAGRAKLEVGLGEHVTFTAHHEVSVATPAAPSRLEVAIEELYGQPVDAGTATFGSGVGLGAPEAVDLTWTAAEDDPLTVQGRTDRFAVTGRAGPVDVAVGRQPITFGNGLIFTPLDLVAPFNAAVIDQEYKPGVDAVRVDAFAGTGGRLTAVAAYAGDWDLDGMVAALHGQTTVGVTDVSAMVAEVYGDLVGGAGVWTSVGPVGTWADAAVTVPGSSEDPFVRGVLGAQWRPGSKTTLLGEAYVQTFGAADAADYDDVALTARFQRGEVWLMGRGYGAVSVSQEITPLVAGTASVIANPVDPSALVMASASVSVSEGSDLVVGAFYGLGARPTPDGSDPLGLLQELRSEFGLYPAAAFLQMKAYF